MLLIAQSKGYPQDMVNGGMMVLMLQHDKNILSLNDEIDNIKFAMQQMVLQLINKTNKGEKTHKESDNDSINKTNKGEKTHKESDNDSHKACENIHTKKL